jgi:HK97 family phage major capsid protein
VNAVLERKRAEQAAQIAFVDELLAKVEADGGRDLVEAEQKNLEAARGRIRELDEQIDPLEEYEAMRGRHQAAAGAIAQAAQGHQNGHAAALGGGGREAVYSTAGAFVVDLIRARGYMVDGRTGQRQAPDPEAAGRVQYALQNQTTADTPGLLPHLIVGQVVNLIDASRPFITSVGGGRSMGGIPGKTFGRPKITQHTLAGLQTAEKAELPTRKMVIGEVAFTKLTKGGAVDVSRQDIDWTSPAAWDILVRDLADAYAIDTENEAADAFAAGAASVNAATPVATGDLEGLSTALYTAAGLVYASAKRLPDRIWMGADMWGRLGPMLDLACCASGSPGDSSLTSFSGNLFNVDRVVVPSFPPATVIVGWSGAFEVYEEVIGLLTAVEPSLLGVEVAYGGYIAFNYVAAEGVAPLGPVPAPLAAGRTSSTSKA